MQANIGYTTAERDSRSWSNGDVILNLDSNKLQLRTGGTWIDNPSTPSAPTPPTMLSVSTNTTLATNTVYSTDATSGNITHTLPNAIGKDGEVVYIKKMDSSVNIITVQTTLSQTIDDDLTAIIQYQNTLIGFQSTGTNWIII